MISKIHNDKSDMSELIKSMNNDLNTVMEKWFTIFTLRNINPIQGVGLLISVLGTALIMKLRTIEIEFNIKKGVFLKSMLHSLNYAVKDIISKTNNLT